MLSHFILKHNFSHFTEEEPLVKIGNLPKVTQHIAPTAKFVIIPLYQTLSHYATLEKDKKTCQMEKWRIVSQFVKFYTQIWLI